MSFDSKLNEFINNSFLGKSSSEGGSSLIAFTHQKSFTAALRKSAVLDFLSFGQVVRSGLTPQPLTLPSDNRARTPKMLLGAFALRKSAFTIAEVIVALVVVGIVAAFVVPSLIQDSQSKVNEKRFEVIKSKISKATDMMKINGDLDQFESTDDFVNVLSHYLKINKRCDSSNLEECWPTKTVKTSDGKTVEVKAAKHALMEAI